MDPQTVVAAQGGDVLALDQLLDELVPYVRRLCAGIAPAAVDDATQEALIAIFRNLRRLRAPEAIVGWARVITVRAAIRVAQEVSRELVLGEIPDRVEDRALPQALVEIIDTLQRIAPDQRAVLVLRQIEGLSEREVAQALGVPVGTVKSRLHRARSKFREAWYQ